MEFKSFEQQEKLFAIEDFTETDQEEVAKLGRIVSEEIGQTYNPELDADWDNIKEVYIASGGAFYVVRSSGQIVGCAGVKKIDDQTAEFKRARILKEYRGNGIGGQLLKKSINFAESKNMQKIILDTPRH